MTATPRIYGDVVKEQKNNGEVVLYSMDDEPDLRPDIPYDHFLPGGCVRKSG